jgi:hypothetical protein
MGEVIIIDVWKANQLLDEPRRVIEEVARCFFFKGKHYHFQVCPVWANYIAKKEKHHAGSY